MASDDQKTDRLDLAAIRQRIDEIDERIQALINERASIAQEVGVAKGELASAVDYYRPEREAEVLRSVLERNDGPLRDEEMLRLFREIMSACLAQQEPLKIGFLGPEGTFHADRRVQALRTFRARAAVPYDRRGVPGGRVRRRRFRRRADRELDRGLGQQHARHVSDVAAEDRAVRSSCASNSTCWPGTKASTRSSEFVRMSSRWHSVAAGFARICRTSS